MFCEDVAGWMLVGSMHYEKCSSEARQISAMTAGPLTAAVDINTMRHCRLRGLPHTLILVAFALAGLYAFVMERGLSQAQTVPDQSRGVRPGVRS